MQALRIVGTVVALVCAGVFAKDIFLLTGQSNMVGDAAIEVVDTPMLQRVYLLDALARWEPARNPFNRYSSCNPGSRLGPGYTFGKTLSEAVTDRDFGIVQNACGGQPIDAWGSGSDLYTQCVQRTKAALAKDPPNRLRAILWHQGESDAAPYAPAGNEALYMSKLKRLVQRLRTDFGDSTLPFIAGQVPQVKTGWIDCAKINAVLLQVPDSIPYSAVASSDGLTWNSDSIHFDSRSQRILGARYAQKVMTMCYGVRLSPETLSFTVDPAASDPTAQVAIVKSADVALPRLSAQADAAWLRASIVGSGNNQSLQVVAALAGLSSGIYKGIVSVSGSSVYVELAVTLRISGTPVAKAMVIAPSVAYIRPGGSVAFDAVVTDQFLERFTGPVAWSASGGGSVAGGNFTSSGTTGVFKVFATVVSAPMVVDTAQVDVVNLAPGMAYDYFESALSSTRQIAALRAVRSGIVDRFDISTASVVDNFAYRFAGFISIDQPGSYLFSIASDDGSELRIDGNAIVSNDGTHGVQTRTGVVTLSQGIHPIEVLYFEAAGGSDLSVSWQPPSASALSAIPPAVLFHRQDGVVFASQRGTGAGFGGSRPVALRLGGLCVTLAVPSLWDISRGVGVEIFDLRGKLIWSAVANRVSTGRSLVVDAFAGSSMVVSGNYLVRMRCGNQSIVTQTVVTASR